MQNPTVFGLVLSALLLTGGGAFAQKSEDSSSPAQVLLQAMEQQKPDEASDQKPKLVLGWLENVRLLPGKTLMKAKLDSGARSSAIHAEEIEYFLKDGKDMVRFTILKDHKNPDGDRYVFERPLIREVNIKLRYTPVRDERPVVRLQFCLAGENHNARFSLTNRSDFNYPVLLGREFLKNNILIDSEESFTHHTRCP